LPDNLAVPPYLNRRYGLEPCSGRSGTPAEEAAQEAHFLLGNSIRR
jgi:hypothetical protein